MRRPGPDAGDRLVRALRDGFAALGVRAVIEERTSRDWASITFSGGRHRISLRIEGKHAGGVTDIMLANFAESALDLRGHILVDLAVISDVRDEDGLWVRLGIEALTVESN